MREVRPMPRVGDIFADVRGDDRTMRVSYHADEQILVVSLWLGPLCRGSFRMSADDVERLISMLTGMKLAVVAASGAGPGPGGSVGEAGADLPPPVGAGLHGAEPPVAQTGEIDRVADAGRPGLAPALDVA